MSESKESKAENQSMIASAPLPELYSEKSTARLQQIAKLRAHGVGEQINLPQIVVCGNQSVGKSSVLAGITQFPFPRQDGICTRFATEITLTHRDQPLSILARVIPSSYREAVSRTKLQNFNRVIASMEQLSSVIIEVGTLMGVKPFCEFSDAPSFVEDVLSITISGPTGLHLTVVDLPGLIEDPDEGQTEEDVATIRRLVYSYAENPRTIILAIIQAGVDISNQSIVGIAGKVDSAGKRTVGVITKPDLINEGTEAPIALLVSNNAKKRFKHGFFIVKNPSPKELDRKITLEQQQMNEQDFFQTPAWEQQDLDPKRIGAVKLRTFLQTLLDDHIERELPGVVEELNTQIKKSKSELSFMGEERQSPGQIRMFLTNLTMNLHSITSAAVNGDYHGLNSKFFTERTSDKVRLRARVHDFNKEFSDYMSENGLTRKVVPSTHWDSDGCLIVSAEEGQTFLETHEMQDWIHKIYRQTRGRELPGNYNHVLLTELFHKQSSRWYEIAGKHTKSISALLDDFVMELLPYATSEGNVLKEFQTRIFMGLRNNKSSAADELERLCDDERQQPITYNHYYTDNLQKFNQADAEEHLKAAIVEATVEETTGVKWPVTTSRIDGEMLLQSLRKSVNHDMEDQACTEALAGLKAYCKVARKTFVDNVCKQVIERHLVRKLPQIFHPSSIVELSDDEVLRIGGESPEHVTRRRLLKETCANLQASLAVLH